MRPPFSPQGVEDWSVGRTLQPLRAAWAAGRAPRLPPHAGPRPPSAWAPASGAGWPSASGSGPGGERALL